MGWFSDLLNRNRQVDTVRNESVGIDMTASEDGNLLQTFNDSNITFSGSISGFDYDSILRDKQKNIYELYKLSDYFSDADPLYKGIIKHVYTPFASSVPFRLIGGDQKTREKYLTYYERINIRKKIESIMYQYFKYGNVFIYVMDGNIITLPVHKCRVASMSIDGNPIIEFNVETIKADFAASGIKIRRGWLDDEKVQERLKGFPPEVSEALNRGEEWAQMNPNNAFVMQGYKEDWQRYAVPLIASCLPALAKKALIGKYEDSMLNLGMRGIVHVQYGGTVDGKDLLVDNKQLSQISKLFQKAMKGYPLVVTNHLCKSSFTQADTNNLFTWDKYKSVNNDILSAGGVSAIVVSGVSGDGSTFASAQVSIQTVSRRIQIALDALADIMNRINCRLNGDPYAVTRSSSDRIPQFVFMPLDMEGRKQLEKTCQTLWREGVLSTETLLTTYGYDMDEETIRRKEEKQKGIDEALFNRTMNRAETSEDTGKSKAGRPAMDNTERNSDPSSSVTGKMPKSSNPEGSMDSVTDPE